MKTRLSTSDLKALDVFRSYEVTTGQMLCFHNLQLEEHSDSLQRLTSQGLLTKERFAGGYSLTAAGFDAMQDGRDKQHLPE